MKMLDFFATLRERQESVKNMEYNLVYFKRKGVMVYVSSNDSYVVSYLLDKPHKEIIDMRNI